MAEEARVKLEDAEHAKDAALDDTRGLVEQVKADQMTLVLQMRAKGEENEKLQKVIADKDKLLKKQETKMLQMAEMESQIQSLRAENMLNYKKMHAQHEAKTAQFQNDIKRLAKLEAENAKYSERIKQLEAEVKRAKTSYTVMHYLDEQARSSRLESLYRSKTKAYEEADIKVKALKEAADKFKAEALEWQKKYKTLCSAVEEENNKQSDKRVPVDVHKKADELSVCYYKDLVHEKDKEIQTLLKRINRLSAGDLRWVMRRGLRPGVLSLPVFSSALTSLVNRLRTWCCTGPALRADTARKSAWSFRTALPLSATSSNARRQRKGSCCRRRMRSTPWTG
jgi:predicted nuclease with TOPRIM domain